jgi:DCN1-like protein 1/2
LLTSVYRYFAGGGGGATASPAGKSTLNKLFDSFRDDAENEPDAVGPGGSMAYIEKVGVDPEDLEVLALLETIQAPTMGEMSRKGFVDGWLAVKYDMRL